MPYVIKIKKINVLKQFTVLCIRHYNWLWRQTLMRIIIRRISTLLLPAGNLSCNA